MLKRKRSLEKELSEEVAKRKKIDGEVKALRSTSKQLFHSLHLVGQKVAMVHRQNYGTNTVGNNSITRRKCW